MRQLWVNGIRHKLKLDARCVVFRWKFVVSLLLWSVNGTFFAQFRATNRFRFYLLIINFKTLKQLNYMETLSLFCLNLKVITLFLSFFNYNIFFSHFYIFISIYWQFVIEKWMLILLHVDKKIFTYLNFNQIVSIQIWFVLYSITIIMVWIYSINCNDVITMDNF